MVFRRSLPLLAGLLALTLLPAIASASRTPWNGERVGELASRLLEQTRRLESELQAKTAEAEAAAPDRDREAGVGMRTVVIADLAILTSRAKAYRTSVGSGLGREDTRSLFGRIDSLVSLTARDMRSLPDFARYRSGLEALEKTVKTLGGFYAESIEVRTPPDPLEEMNR